MSLVPTDAEWLALCLVTESNRPDEWPHIAQVIENRRATGRWGDTYRDVILAPKQFSAFNDYTKVRNPRLTSDEFGMQHCFYEIAKEQSDVLLMRAAAFVSLDDAVWSGEISRTTFHYWSPVSMVPKGRKPAWTEDAKRVYTPNGVDPERFVFAEGVP